MTTTDYLINAMFILVVVRQARERELDLRSALVPLAMVLFVGHMYIHSIPTAGNDLVLIGLLATAGIGLGLASGFATHVRAGQGDLAMARVGWLAGVLLVFGICARMAFAFTVTHGAEPAIRSFSVAHHITAGAWPVALVSMAICEVTVRILTVQGRGRHTMRDQAATTAAIGAAA